jgi:hypothetical protein
VWADDRAPAADRITFKSVRILDEEGSVDSSLATGDRIAVEIRYIIHRSIANLRIAMSLFTDDGIEVLATSDFDHAGTRRVREPGEYTSTCLIPGGFLNTGRYTISVDADIPRTVALVRDVQLSFDIDELTSNHLGITIASRPAGIVHPYLPWQVTRDSHSHVLS